MITKRRIIGLLIISLLTTMLPVAYAETPVTSGKTPGQVLSELGLVSGYANGNLGESDQLTRAQMMVLIAQLKGENEMAKNYALPSSSIDVDPYAWYAPYVAYAEAHQWTAGISKNRFGPDQYLTSQQAATFMLKILGYEVADYKNVMNQAYALGLLKNGSTNAKEFTTRGNVFQYMLNTLYTPVANTSINLGVSLGVVIPQKPEELVKKYIVKSVTPLSGTLIEVKLKEPTTAADLKQFTVKTSNGTTLELVKADLIDTSTIWLTTQSQSPGTQYICYADSEFRFSGMGKDLLLPSLVKDNSGVMDFISVKLTFDKDMDPRSALDIANYKVDNGLTLLSAKFDKDKDGKDERSQIILTTSSQERSKLYTLQVSSKVTDVSGNSVNTENEKSLLRFAGMIADTAAPRLTNVYSLNGQKIVLMFNDQSDLDQASAENIGNYTVINRSNANNGLNIISAKLVKDTDLKYLMVELKTTQQVVGNSYELSVSNVTDKFGNMISATTSYKGAFTGQSADTAGPKLLFVQPISNIRVDLNFDEEVSKESAEVTSNYSVDNDLSIIKAELDSDDAKIVHLTTSAQYTSRLYKIKANGVMDEYGNVNSNGSTNTAYFNGMYEDTSSPKILTASASVEDSKTYVTIKYSKNMGESAKVPTNYYFNNDLSYGLSVVKISDSEYKIRTNTQTEGKAYSVEVRNVLDASGHDIDDNYEKASFFGKAVSDTELPKIDYVVTQDRMTIKVAFNRAMQTKYTGKVITSDGVPSDSDISDPDNYQIYLGSNTSPLNLGTYKAYVDADKRTVTLRMSTNLLTSDNSYTVKANSVESTDPIDGLATGLYSDNGLILQTYSAKYGFRGNPSDAVKPRISNAVATSKETIDVYFNTDIKLSGFTDTSITVSGNGQTLNAMSAYTSVSSTEPNVLRVGLNGKMTSGSTRYDVILNDLSSITDMYGDMAVDSVSNGNRTTVYSNSTENYGPTLVSVTVNDATSITAEFSKELDVADVNDYRITTNASDIIPNYAEFVNGNRDKVRLYFDSTYMSLGKAYRLKVPAYAVSDTYGKTNNYAEEKYFGLTSAGRTKVTISDFGAVGSNTLRIMFSKPIADMNSVLSSSDFTITSVTSGAAWTIDKAYSNGSVIYPNSLGQIPQGTYVELVDLKCDKLLGKDVTYTISLATPLNFLAKDGAAIDGTPSKSAIGKVNLDTYKFTTGLTTAALGSGSLKVTATDANMNAYTVRTTYAKMGVLAKLSSASAYSTQLKLLSEINNYNVLSATAKGTDGTTSQTVTGLTAGTYDLVVVFYNQKNEFVGYCYLTNVNVN